MITKRQAFQARDRVYHPQTSVARRFEPHAASTPCDPPTRFRGADKHKLTFMVTIRAFVIIVARITVELVGASTYILTIATNWNCLYQCHYPEHMTDLTIIHPNPNARMPSHLRTQM